MNKNYDTMVEALNGLRKQGYAEDFNLSSECIECPTLKLKLRPEQFQIDMFYRFEGMSNPDDNSIVYAISSRDGVKGVLVDGYGVSATSLNEAMIKKLDVRYLRSK